MYQFPTNPEDGDLINHPNGKDYAWNNTRGEGSVVRADRTKLSGRVAGVENRSVIIVE